MKLVTAFLLSLYCYAGFAQTPVNIGQTVQLHSAILNEERTIFIYLPDGYAQTTARYPVVYLLDAETHFLHTATSAAFLGLLGQMPKCIVVSVANTDRARDMTPKPAVPDKDFPGGGGSDTFLHFMTKELLPYVQSHYRTDPFKVLAGTSLSGLFAINTFVKDPFAFNAYIAASPALWWDEQAVVNRSENTLKTVINKNRFLFISLCDGDSKVLQESTQRLLTTLKTRQQDSLHYQYLYIPGENHNSSPLKSFYAGFEWLYNDWQIESVGTLDSLQQHYNYLSAKYGYTIEIPEAQINSLGYNLLFSGRHAEAIKAFKLNTEKNPGSANAWDSMGDAYKLSGDLQSAKASYSKGCAIAKQTNDINASSMCNNLAEVIKLISQKGKK